MELEHLHIYMNELEYKKSAKVSSLDPMEIRQQLTGNTDHTLRVARLSTFSSSGTVHKDRSNSLKRPSLPETNTVLIGRNTSLSRSNHIMSPSRSSSRSITHNPYFNRLHDGQQDDQYPAAMDETHLQLKHLSAIAEVTDSNNDLNAESVDDTQTTQFKWNIPMEFNASFLSVNYSDHDDIDGYVSEDADSNKTKLKQTTTTTIEVSDVDITADEMEDKRENEENKQEMVVLDSMSDEEFYKILNEYNLVYSNPPKNATQVMNFARQGMNRFFKYKACRIAFDRWKNE